MAKSSKDRRVVAGFVNYLRSKEKTFAQLALTDQLELAHMVWSDHMKLREHYEINGATSYTYQELEQRFGRGRFTNINAELDAFHVGQWDAKRGTTRSFQLSPMFKAYRHRYFKGIAKQMTTSSFLNMQGRRIKTLPRPISSKRTDGSTVKLWGGIEMVSTVPVNLDLLQALYKSTWNEITRVSEKKASHDLFGNVGNIDKDKLQIRAEWAATLLVLANTDLTGKGWMPMRYQEVESGRLYAVDTNLQNCPREVRMAALNGFLDYDISNCHYTLLEQMAVRFGFACPRIRYYLENKKAVRSQLAEEVSIDVGAVKTCLLALIYGAVMTSSPRATFAQTVGQDKAKLLIAHPLFAELAREVRLAGAVVLDKFPKRSGSLINDAGCGIRQNQNKRKKLAHLLQGAEALILKTTVQYLEAEQPSNVILLQHDGFTAKQPINTAALESHIEEQTGYRVAFEVERIQPSADLDFSKLMKA